MSYVSPYLLNPASSGPGKGQSKRPCLSAADALNDTTMSISEKHHALDKLEHEALAALTMRSNDIHGKSPKVMLDEIMAARKIMHHEN